MEQEQREACGNLMALGYHNEGEGSCFQLGGQSFLFFLVWSNISSVSRTEALDLVRTAPMIQV